jgi:endoglucanase
MRKRMRAPDLLQALLEAPGPSGHEEEPNRIWRDAASAFAEVTSDTLGTSFARVRSPRSDGATVALVSHIDEVGVTVTNVEDGGLLSFTTVGGISPETLSGQRIEFLTHDGSSVPGAIGRKRLSPEQRREAPRVELADLHIDIGATSREEAERIVRPGDVAVWNGAPVELPNGRLMSRSLDNRLGAYVVLEAARRLGDLGGELAVDVVAVAATQEEIGSVGARAAAYGLEPAVAIAVDVTPATDYPGGDPRRAGRVELGMGAMIARGPTLNKLVSQLLADVAESEAIPHGFEVYTRQTATDADEFHAARAGVPTGLVSIPMRYLHTPNELSALEDVEAVIRLLVAATKRLEPGASFVR